MAEDSSSLMGDSNEIKPDTNESCEQTTNSIHTHGISCEKKPVAMPAEFF